MAVGPEFGLDGSLERRGAGEGELAFDANAYPAVLHRLEVDGERRLRIVLGKVRKVVRLGWIRRGRHGDLVIHV